MENPIQKITFKDGERAADTGELIEKSMVVAPVMLQLQDLSITHVLDGSTRTSVFLIGVVPQEIVISVRLVTSDDIIYYVFCLVALIISLCISSYCVYETSKAVINPLTHLNMRMTEILHDDINAVSLDAEGKCSDIKSLQERFSDLISDYKFT